MSKEGIYTSVENRATKVLLIMWINIQQNRQVILII